MRPARWAGRDRSDTWRRPRLSTSGLRCGAVRCGAVRCGAVRCGAVRCGAVRCGAVRCGAVRCGETLHDLYPWSIICPTDARGIRAPFLAAGHSLGAFTQR
ncbi:hypothetical protein CDV53_01320 [Haematobacter missouriensis]|uniref:Uncharacterized protein n=1 Tax=Haematobacter missouriensis TaxID=366616 RepID=A0ABX3ZYB3_9RHOB|nr:hypothetical protein CDV53_01320 [Haematobacter missouriensis]